MSEWWTYRPEDLLLFSPRVYWRMFELHNAAVWPLQLGVLALGAVLLALVIRAPAWAGRAVAVLLAAAWLWVAWSFLWSRYAGINWAAGYVAPVFGAEALLLAALSGHLGIALRRSPAGLTGLALLVYALALHPLVAPLAGRPLAAAEVFAIAPDPTAIATLGLLAMASGGPWPWLLMIVPLLWCLASFATLDTMGAPEGWIPLAAAVLAATARLADRRPRPA